MPIFLKSTMYLMNYQYTANIPTLSCQAVGYVAHCTPKFNMIHKFWYIPNKNKNVCFQSIIITCTETNTVELTFLLQNVFKKRWCSDDRYYIRHESHLLFVILIIKCWDQTCFTHPYMNTIMLYFFFEVRHPCCVSNKENYKA
jgi:hypothetical protein